MAAVKLTKTYVESLSYTEKGQKYYHDAELKGFGVAVAMQSKTYFAQRDIFGKTVRVTIGKHGVFTTDKAREEARQLLARMAKGENPNATKREERQKQLTFEEALEAYRKGRKHLSQTTHYRLDCLKTLYLPDWQRVQMHELTRDMVFKRHLKIGEKHGKTQANTVFQLVRAIYNFSLQGHDHLPPNPVSALSSAKAWYKETRRRSVIKPHQIKPWYDTVRMLDNSTIRDYLLLLLFTGMRRIEAMELRWENVDFAEKMLTVPHTKNNEPLDLPLSDYVFRLLQERKKRTGKSPWVFTGDGKTGHLVEPKNSVKKIAEDSGVPFMRLIKRRLAKSLRKSPSLQLTLQIQAMLHVLWLFPEPLELRDTAQREAVFLLYKRFQKMLESYFTAHEYELDKVGDLARVFRVPDTLNHKGEKPVPVTIWEARPDNRVTIEEVKTYLDKHYPKQVKPKKKEHSFPLADADLIREECGWFNYCIEDAETLSEPECYAALSILGRCKDGAALAHEYSKDYPHYSAAETIKKLNQAMLTAKPRTCENIRMECGAEEYCQQCPHFGKISSPIQLGTKRNEASSTKERLLETAKRAKYWHTKNDTAYATITRNGHKEHMVLQSTRFCKRLTFQMREEGGKPPAKQAIDEVPGLLEAQAIFDGLEHEVFLRVAYHDDRLYIDRGTEDWSAIEVRANGWDIIAEPPVRFIRSDSMQPLPETSRKGDIMLLKRYIPCDTPDEFKLIIGFILGVFAPHKPYPLAVLTGLAGCGKTTRARVIVELTDPSSSALIGSPKEDRDIFATASSRWLTTLDNIKQVSDSISNALCCISTGIASSGRLYHTNMGIFETPEFARPMMMTGIELRLRQDLRSRSIFFEFSPLAAKDCKTEREYYECFAQDKPVIFGGILDALSGALCNWKQTEIALQGKEKPRLADHTV